jgi:hypothetical protein
MRSVAKQKDESTVLDMKINVMHHQYLFPFMSGEPLSPIAESTSSAIIRLWGLPGDSSSLLLDVSTKLGGGTGDCWWPTLGATNCSCCCGWYTLGAIIVSLPTAKQGENMVKCGCMYVLCVFTYVCVCVYIVFMFIYCVLNFMLTIRNVGHCLNNQGNRGSSFFIKYIHKGRSQWPRGPRHEMSSPAQTLGSWVRIPFETQKSLRISSMFVLPCVGSGLAAGLIIRPMSLTNCL